MMFTLSQSLVWKQPHWIRVLTSLSRLVPAAVVGRASGLYGLKRAWNTSETPRVDLVIPAGLGWPQP